MLRRFAAVLGVLATLALAGCSSTVHLEPADDANNPACAEVTVRLPEVVAGQERRWTDAQATGAWGEPTAVILSCGVTVPGPTAELQCVTLEGIDWLVDESDSPRLRMTSYGRDPAVQVFVDTERVSSNEVLTNAGLVSAVRTIPAERSCIAPDTLPEG
ncbi:MULTISPECIES: DUF3515 domain-containing protein [Microbacterium]|uniref:DUF3515 domain-containing protein n=1 Tax=Microbacterium TaxID=33882 RepID=UPI00217E4DF1|nr:MULTISPECIES: DUF3515 domain-containing protein [Microbacterium]UWF78442.1 DUF3515 family protein [Microbacterium neungamense]WCM56618.1 DUF3515 family protein [Microbacterium sp. EF45047]